MATEWEISYTPQQLQELILLFRRNVHNKCFYCGKQISRNRSMVRRDPSLKKTVDHVIAKARGGHEGLCNKVPACKACNADKADLTLEEFRYRRKLKNLSYEFFAERELRLME